MEPKHSPLPWAARPDKVVGLIIEDARGSLVVSDPMDAVPELPTAVNDQMAQRIADDFAYIVRACNAHDALVEAVEGLLQWVDATQHERNFLGGKPAQARAALKLAREVTPWP